MVVVADRIVVQDCSAYYWQPILVQFAASNGGQLAQFQFAHQVRFGCDLSAVLRAIAWLFCSSLTGLRCLCAVFAVNRRRPSYCCLASPAMRTAAIAKRYR